MFQKAIAICLLATPCLAECPIAADLADGIQLTIDDGTVELYRAQSPDRVETTTTYPDGFEVRTITANGVYVTEVADMIDGKVDLDARTTYRFPMKAADMPTPAPGGTWHVNTSADDGYDTFSDSISVNWGDETNITYADCTYRMIPGTLRYSTDDYSEVIHYLPDLGFAVLASYSEGAGGRPEVLRVTGIAKVDG